MTPELRVAVTANILSNIRGKDLSTTSWHKLYDQLYPDQVSPGHFEYCFRDAVNQKVEEEKRGGDGETGNGGANAPQSTVDGNSDTGKPAVSVNAAVSQSVSPSASAGTAAPVVTAPVTPVTPASQPTVATPAAPASPAAPVVNAAPAAPASAPASTPAAAATV